MSNVRVFIRERPSAAQPIYEYVVNEGSVTLTTNNSKATHHFTLDGVLEQNSSQADIFNQIGAPAVKHLLQSFNSSIICYGATFTGKSYTAIGDEQNPGLAPQVLQNIFKQLDIRQGVSTSTVFISLLELYFDKPTDLINNQPLNIRQNDTGFYCENLTTVEINSPEQGISILNKASQNRITGANYANEKSSRSHVLINFGVKSINRENGESTASVLTIVDLAGSESIRKGNSDGIRLAEAQSINKTLSTLCQVVNSLATRRDHIPYRDSKLTKLLSMSLGGNSYTSIICTIDSSQEDESIQTIQFANRCRNVINNPNIQYTDIDKIGQNSLIKRLQDENLTLKVELEEMRNKQNEMEEQLQNQDQQFVFQPQQMNNDNKLLSNDFSITNKKPLSQNQLSRPQSVISQQQKQPSIASLQNSLNSSVMQPQKDSIAILRQKLVAKNDMYLKVAKELDLIKAQNRQKDTDFRQKLSDLEGQIKQNQQLYDLKLSEKEQEKMDAIKVISQGSQSLLNTQSALISTVQTLVPEMTQKSFREFEIDNIIEDEKIQISTQIDIQNLQFREQLDQRHEFEMEKLKDRYKLQIDSIQSQKDQLAEQCQLYLESLNWLYQNYKSVANTLFLAKEGKLESFIVNEKQLLQYLLSQQNNSLKPQRKHVHTCLMLNDSQLPKQIPGRINNIVQNVIVQPKRMSSGLSFSRPNSALSEGVGKILQPHMKTGFVKPKPADIHLNMNVHISPRPNSGISSRPASSMSYRPGSAIGNTGSCQGTTDLVNKAYKQWGF